MVRFLTVLLITVFLSVQFVHAAVIDHVDPHIGVDASQSHHDHSIIDTHSHGKKDHHGEENGLSDLHQSMHDFSNIAFIFNAPTIIGNRGSDKKTNQEINFLVGSLIEPPVPPPLS